MGPDLDELVRRARRERAAPGALAAVARNLRVPFIAAPIAAMVTPSSALASVAGTSSVSRLGLLGWGAGSLVAVSGVVAVVASLGSPTPPSPPTTAPAPRPVSTFAPPPQPEPVATTEPLPAARAEDKPAARRQASTDEPQLIERARKALASEPRRALALALEHQRRFPTGALSVERDVITLEALARSGRTAEARRRALAFEARHPGSIHLPRVRALLARLSTE